MIRGICPFCGRVFRVDDRYAGQTGECKTCGAEVTVPGESVPEPDRLPPATEPEAAPSRPARSRGRILTQRVDASAPVSEEDAAPSAPPTKEEGWEDLRSSHDARSRYEPEEGPTALKGAWTSEGEEDSPERGDFHPTGLGTSHILTEVADTVDYVRPTVLVFACIDVLLLALSFCVYSVIQAGTFGGVVGGIVVLLAGLGFARLWLEHWDGLIPAFLACLAVLTLVVIASLPRAGEQSPMTLASVGFLLGGLAAIGLLCLCAFRESCHEYFGG